MSLLSRIETDYIAAYKNKDAVLLNVLRMVKTAAKNLQVELRRPLEDAEWLDTIAKQCKQRQDSIEQFTNAGRMDLADKESAELTVLRSYLPEQLSETALREAIQAAIKENAATGPKDMGKVIQSIMAVHKGQVDGKQVSALVKEALS